MKRICFGPPRHATNSLYYFFKKNNFENIDVGEKKECLWSDTEKSKTLDIDLFKSNYTHPKCDFILDFGFTLFFNELEIENQISFEKNYIYFIYQKDLIKYYRDVLIFSNILFDLTYNDFFNILNKRSYKQFYTNIETKVDSDNLKVFCLDDLTSLVLDVISITNNVIKTPVILENMNENNFLNSDFNKFKTVFNFLENEKQYIDELVVQDSETIKKLLG